MSDLSELQVAVIERLARAESQGGDHERRVQILEEKNDHLSRMTTVLESQVNQLEKTNCVLEKMSDNLDNLNRNYTDLNNRVGRIEEEQQEDDVKRWDWNAFVKNLLYASIPAIMSAIIVYMIIGK